MDQPLYEKIADQIEQQIKEGTFLPGTKIPSVRKLSTQFTVSIATVLQAYGLLEDRGIVKARPQKGYFVQENIPVNNHIASVELSSSNSLEPIQKTIKTLLQKSQNTNLLQFGATTPSTQFLPIRQLQRSVGRLMRLEPEVCISYEFTPGSLSLRRQIAIRMLDTGYNAQPDEIIVTLGCQNALMHTLQAITKPRDIVAIETPTYHGILQIINTLQLQAIEIPCHSSTGIDIDTLEDALKKWSIKACIVTPNNQNPTGSNMSEIARNRLLTTCNHFNVPIIEDDVYGELSYQDKRQQSIKALDQTQNVIYCSSFSKSIAPGFRIGWVIGGRYHEQIEQYIDVQSFAIPTLTQRAIANFLENGAYDRHLRKTRQIYETNLQHIRHSIFTYFPSDTEVSDPQGGFLLWVKLPHNVNALLLHKHALEHGIAIMPGLVFDLSQAFTHHLRLNYAVNWDNSTNNAIRLLGQLAKKIQLNE